MKLAGARGLAWTVSGTPIEAFEVLERVLLPTSPQASDSFRTLWSDSQAIAKKIDDVHN